MLKPFPANAPALRPAFLLASVLLLSGCSLLSKKPNDDASGNGPPSFELEVEAPSDVRELLLQHMELQQYRRLSDLRRSELSRLLGAADANIRSLLGTLGYFSPTIELQLIETPSDSDTPRKVRVQVEPGPATIVRSTHISFSGTNAEDPSGRGMREGIRRDLERLNGERFSQSAWSNAKNEGVRRLQNRRYPTANLVDSRADIDADLNEAELRLDYAPGPAYSFGPLVIQGAERYNPAGLIRLARLPVGEEYRQTTLLEAQQRLANSGYYDSVFLTLATEVAQPGDTEVQAPVIAEVREAKLQKWIYGLGVSTDTGFRFSIDHTHNRVPYLDWRAQSKLQLDQKNPQLSTRLTSLPDYSGWNYFVGAKAAREELADYMANSATLVAGRSKSEDKIDRSYYLQYDMAKAQGDGAPPSSSSITLNYGWTGRYFNNPTNPTRGYGLGWEVGAGNTITPERKPFGRMAARWLYYLPLERAEGDTGRRSRLAFRANGGAVIANGNTVVPITQLFLSGGDTTVRGYSYQSIGARTDNGKLIGGRYMASGSVEWQRPITVAGNRSDWEHATFVDAGTVTDALDTYTVFVGVGTGIRWRSPVGPLQADLAYGLETKKVRLHLRLGFNF
ncbi:autotransporter assembly complex protein TamA [Comamonas aquatica]|uniref:autotransporter assembly complex protein TamA n=1 Tax=Comamonas aquatica TaxID=225991 RepID=UPI002448ECF2|nr:BamA/TamA family outer membrane protein [Comamonas aquatica]MDH0202290.1 BamA/TamA family outer membrane protein [Comamonas aquatica]MDH1447405.1 BamA/TamA family outer membrane protein [Comamonas aquatica]